MKSGTLLALASVIFGFAALGAACVGDSDEVDIAQNAAPVGAIVRGEHLQDALSGVDMRPGMPGLLFEGSFERFCASGSWYTGNVRAPRQGRFEVNDDQFCVVIEGDPDAPRCRRLYRRTDSDEYFFVEDVQPSNQSQPSPTSLARLDQPSC